MGWNHDDVPEHEGLIVGQIRGSSSWKDIDPPEDFRGTLDVVAVHAACACGWRSARYSAPVGTTWAPRGTDLPSSAAGLRVEKGLRRLWLEHADAIAEPVKDDDIAAIGAPVF
jgi:hypothetical protein